MSNKLIKGPQLQRTHPQSVGKFFFDNAERFRDRTCQIDANLDKTETYSSVKIRSVRAAIELQNRGVTSKDVVVLCTKLTLDNIIPMVASYFLGAKVANLHPSQSVRQTTHLLSLVRPKIIFVEEESLDLIEDSLESAGLKAQIVVFGDSSKHAKFCDFVQPQANEEAFRPSKVDIHDVAVIMFSSGTTGLPKAICHSHYSFVNMAYAQQQIENKSHSFLSFVNFYFLSASTAFLFTVVTGGHIVFCSTTGKETTFKMIEKYKITGLHFFATFVSEFTNFERHHEYDTSSLRLMIINGARSSTTSLQKLQQVFKNTNLLVAYGSTEIGIITIFDPATDQHFMKTKAASCGKAFPGITLKVVDVSTRQPVGPKQKGEICVKSPAVMTGYYNGDSSTVFDNEGFLKTGDVGYYDDDGCLYVIDRLKEMFKYWIWHIIPSAIEEVLLEHPAIEEVAVFGTPSEKEGEVPTACVVLKEGCCVHKEEIEEFLAERVADYEKLRGGVAFVETLQKTASGKLSRREIRSAYLQRLGML